jgi:hypothetical protein
MSLYVYGITDASHPGVPDGTTGVGDPAPEVRQAGGGRLAALVSEAPDGIRPKRRDLLAHQRVLELAGTSGPVLPLRFGGISPDEETLTGVLAEREDHYTERLRSLAGKVEFNLKASHDEDAVVRLVLESDPDLRETALAHRDTGGGTQEQRIALGERVALGVQRREAEDARVIREAMEQVCDEVSAGPEGRGWLANLSFLVPADGIEGLRKAVEQLDEQEPHLVLTLTGPLPPYSFVE